MPPGTGDIQMTITQSMALSGAVLVTTPHPLAVADLIKGMSMFHDVKVPPLAVVGNSSRCNDVFVCIDCVLLG